MNQLSPLTTMEIIPKISKTEDLNRILKLIIKLISAPIIISLIVTPIRFFLELAGLPENAIFIIGLLWLTLGLCIHWGFKLYSEKLAYPILLMILLIFSPISRLPVSLFWWIDTHFEIGTHYGAYFTNFQDAIINQVVYGSLVQIIPGFLLGSITIAILKHRKSLRKKNGEFTFSN